VLAGFAYGLIRIDTDAQYQRPDWRAVAQALGASSGPRAVIVYDGLGTDPLALYLSRVPWKEPPGPVDVSEVDVVGYVWQAPANPLPPDVKLIAIRRVGDSLVARFSLAREWRLPRSGIAARASGLLGPGSPGPTVLVQRASTAG
jgi:hypothetical protein